MNDSTDITEFGKYGGDLTGVDATVNDSEIDEAKLADAPRPLLWRILVMPVQPRKVSKGGIEIPMQAQEAQQYMNYVGRVVALGHLAYTSARFVRLMRRPGLLGSLMDRLLGPAGQAEPFPVVGDHVIYGRYAGQAMLHRGVKLLIVNDDEVLAIVRDPEALKIYV